MSLIRNGVGGEWKFYYLPSVFGLLSSDFEGSIR